MADKKILFVVQAVYQTIPPVTYEAGQIVTLREDLANRWLSRGLATDDPEQIARVESAKLLLDGLTEAEPLAAAVEQKAGKRPKVQAPPVAPVVE